MTVEIGYFSLIMGFIIAVILALIPFYAAAIKHHHAVLVNFSIYLIYAIAFFILFSCLSLLYATVTDNFTIDFIAEVSNSQLPMMYKIFAITTDKGLMLLTTLLLSMWMLFLTIFRPTDDEKIIPRIFGFLGFIMAGYIFFSVIPANIFAQTAMQEEGREINPLLQEKWFFIHSIFLQAGIIGFIIPFAIIFGYFISGIKTIKTMHWLKTSSLWTSFSLFILLIGIIIGTWWGHNELGWSLDNWETLSPLVITSSILLIILGFIKYGRLG